MDERANGKKWSPFKFMNGCVNWCIEMVPKIEEKNQCNQQFLIDLPTPMDAMFLFNNFLEHL